FNTVFSVAHGLTNIAVVLQMRTVNDDQTIAIFIVMAQIWFLKDIILLACLSIACERLYVTAKELQSTLVVLIQRPGCSEARRRVCKNIKRFQKAGFSKLSACGVFMIDATLPLRLFSFITTHTIVLLQFSL
ncbi:uncharacterized protein LOC135118776, partial [Helicoverpa armigera]|uniref:uncharacterized protein LOC135118776 n=1 Tax=Helicoverpa armigera TaxID=29058 RepID=UPI0030830811